MTAAPPLCRPLSSSVRRHQVTQLENYLMPRLTAEDGNALLNRLTDRARRARCSSRSPPPAVAVREQAFLVVVELLGCLGRELKVRSQDDGVDRAGLLAEAAIDAFHHVDVEAGRPPRAVSCAAAPLGW